MSSSAKGVVSVLACAFLMTGPSGAEASGSLVDSYLESYFQAFPTHATAAGRHDFDDRLENLDPAARSEWIAINRKTAGQLERELASGRLGFEDRLDFELLRRQVARQLMDFVDLARPERDPLFWTQILGNATVFLLVREDLPAAQRLASAGRRARLIPRLARQAQEALSGGGAENIPVELCGLATRQARASAQFYRQGFADAAAGLPELQPMLRAAGAEAAMALERLANFLTELEAEASGSARLRERYAYRFKMVTGVDRPVSEVLSQARADLVAKRRETADFGRQVWSEVFPSTPPAEDDGELIRRLFERVAVDRATTVEEFVDDYRQLVEDSVAFVRRREVITLPEPLTLRLDRSPSYFVGQSVGGVYPAGPYADADTETLLFLPAPPDDASAEQRAAFFRDFNDHFNVMITPHELIPGHYLQLKYAARHPRKVRALFGDGVYIEGWGTFCERLMLDLGWGGALDRLAHLKKQMENIARTIVDIRVHTEELSRPEVLDFVKREAFQDEQFAANMWRRSLTSSPQLTFYYLGYREVHGLYEETQQSQGERFNLRQFMDGMMELGPVPVATYRTRMLGSGH